ncbi:MAG: NYN domain-containing protein [Acidimicrobiales bacterium]
MPARHVVVDGSNIATEGGSLPSLRQLDEAVREFLAENPADVVTVVVDASFGHRIDPSERERFEQAEAAGEVVVPPAGAIGRGDAFLLRIADKVGAVVLSNDSFQEFHGEYEWLFDKGRLIGGKPVPGVGWIFTPRTPVRGAKSRESVKEAKRKKRSLLDEEPNGSGLDMAAERLREHGGERKLQRAIAVAVDEAVEPTKPGRKRRRRHRGGEAPSEPLNDPLSFITFLASHHLGKQVEGKVEEFSSHGAFVSVDGARCYLPLAAMGEPQPRSAREVLRKGEVRPFVVQAFDAMRRGIELAMPGFARPSGGPTDETVEAEIHSPVEPGRLLSSQGPRAVMALGNDGGVERGNGADGHGASEIGDGRGFGDDASESGTGGRRRGRGVAKAAPSSAAAGLAAELAPPGPPPSDVARAKGVAQSQPEAPATEVAAGAVKAPRTATVTARRSAAKGSTSANGRAAKAPAKPAKKVAAAPAPASAAAVKKAAAKRAKAPAPAKKSSAPAASKTAASVAKKSATSAKKAATPVVKAPVPAAKKPKAGTRSTKGVAPAEAPATKAAATTKRATKAAATTKRARADSPQG